MPNERIVFLSHYFSVCSRECIWAMVTSKCLEVFFTSKVLVLTFVLAYLHSFTHSSKYLGNHHPGFISPIGVRFCSRSSSLRYFGCDCHFFFHSKNYWKFFRGRYRHQEVGIIWFRLFPTTQPTLRYHVFVCWEGEFLRIQQGNSTSQTLNAWFIWLLLKLTLNRCGGKVLHP